MDTREQLERLFARSEREHVVGAAGSAVPAPKRRSVCLHIAFSKPTPSARKLAALVFC